MLDKQPQIRPWVCICGVRHQSSDAWRKCYKGHEVVIADKRYVKVVRKGTGKVGV